MASTTRPISVKANPPLHRLRARVEKMRGRIADLSTPYKRSAVFLDQWVQDNFKTEGGNVGGWMPLKGGGRRMAGGIDTGAKILQDTGRLRASFTPFTTKKDAGIGSDMEYAPAHEKGLGPIPQRRMLPVRKEVIKPIRAIFRDHVRKSIRA